MSDAGADADYHDLKRRVAEVLPADDRGRRRPVDGDAVGAYWELGRLLNEHIRGRAAYGRRAVARLAVDLGLLPRTLYRARKLHQRLPRDEPALRRLSWSHCRLLVTEADDTRLRQLMTRAADEGWTVRRLQAHLRPATDDDHEMTRGRPGIYRLRETADIEGRQVLAFDLGFGVLRPVRCLGRVGKRTRRLLRELADGNVVEVVRDHKDRLALRRVWGQVAARLYTYPAHVRQAGGDGIVSVCLHLGFDVERHADLRLLGPAGRLPAADLEARRKGWSDPVVARVHRVADGFGVDLFGLPGETSPRAIAERGEHLNAVWAGS